MDNKINMDINLRQNQLIHLQNYLKEVDIEVTMILQNLQWDRKHLTERIGMVTCCYDTNHRVPPDKVMKHENECFLKRQGYTEGDRLLPSPIDDFATTLVKLSADNIEEIINKASQNQPLFKKGAGCSGPQPLTLERLQATYTADERRAIHDAVVHRVPSCHDLSDLALLSSNNEAGKATKTKSKLEILAELRDMRRRRTKYRVAAKTRNYSDVLRDVITTQMELYSQTHAPTSTTQGKSNVPDSNSKAKDIIQDNNASGCSDENSNRSGHNTERHTSTSVKDTRDISRHSGQHEQHEVRKSGYHDLDRVTRDGRMHYDKSSRRNDADDSTNVNRKRHSDIGHSTRYRHSGKECIRKETATNERALYNTSDKRKDNRTRLDGVGNDYSRTEGGNYSNERHSKDRVKQDLNRYRSSELRPKSKSVHREKRYEYKQTHNQTLTIKKKKDDYDDDDSNGSVDSETEDSSITSYNSERHYSGIKKIKVENYAVKQERNSVNDGYDRKYVKPSEKFHGTQQSNLSYNRHSNSIRCYDKHKRYERYNDGTKYNHMQDQEYREIVVDKVKVEKDAIYDHVLETDGSDRKSRVAYGRHYENRSERHRSGGDKYRMYKKDKEKTHRKY